jgi:hypothetical protein
VRSGAFSHVLLGRLQTEDRDEPGRARAPVLPAKPLQVDALSLSLSLSRLIVPNVPFLGKREMSLPPLKTMRFVSASYRYRHLCLVAERRELIRANRLSVHYRGALAVLGDVTDCGSFFLNNRSASLYAAGVRSREDASFSDPQPPLSRWTVAYDGTEACAIPRLADSRICGSTFRCRSVDRSASLLLPHGRYSPSGRSTRGNSDDPADDPRQVARVAW